MREFNAIQFKIPHGVTEEEINTRMTNFMHVFLPTYIDTHRLPSLTPDEFLVFGEVEPCPEFKLHPFGHYYFSCAGRDGQRFTLNGELLGIPAESEKRAMEIAHEVFEVMREHEIGNFGPPGPASGIETAAHHHHNASH